MIFFSAYVNLSVYNTHKFFLYQKLFIEKIKKKKIILYIVRFLVKNMTQKVLIALKLFIQITKRKLFQNEIKQTLNKNLTFYQFYKLLIV